MKTKSILTVLLLIMAGVQTIRAQKVVLHKTNGQTIECDVSELDSITFDDGVCLTCPDDNHPHAIDLGLPSGTKWCCCNVGADMPESVGGYYAWGETSEKSRYDDVSYIFLNGQDTDGDGRIDQDGSYIDIGLDDIAGTNYDVAHVRMGELWCMPSKEQQDELRDNCSIRGVQQNGVNGILVTGPNGGRIFMPSTGYYWKDHFYDDGGYGGYWSSSRIRTEPLYVFSLVFNTKDGYGFWDWDASRCSYGRPVRPVRVQKTPPARPVTEIVLSETSLTLQVDETKTITAIVLPEDADNPVVTWESSNEDVAEVNKNGRVIANAEGLCTITCRSTDGSGVKAECQVTVNNQKEEAERTVIVYMAADNSLSSFAQSDTIEMAKGKDMIPEDVNFIIFLDDRQNKPAIYELSAKSGMQLWKQYEEELCTTDSLTMLEVLREIEHYFPARHYGITFWSHATGWTPRRKTFGKDETHSQSAEKNEMDIPVMRDVLAQLPKFDYIFFDAVFMQCIEVAYELRDVTNYIVGSPAEIPGPGAPYDKVIKALCKGDAEGIVRSYDSGYPGSYDGYYYPGVLLSCIDCTKLEELATVTGQMLTPFYMDRTEQSPSGFQYYSSLLEKYTYYFDMRTTMCRLLSEEDYTAWMEVFDQAVPLHTLSSTNRWYANTIFFPNESTIRDPECYGGVSMFVPMAIYDSYGWNEAFQKTSWYKAAGWEATGW